MVKARGRRRTSSSRMRPLLVNDWIALSDVQASIRGLSYEAILKCLTFSDGVLFSSEGKALRASDSFDPSTALITREGLSQVLRNLSYDFTGKELIAALLLDACATLYRLDARIQVLERKARAAK